ncbi:MAG: NAD(P)/FAD-dependent oxidoreductase [Thermoplasmata archaeon]|jgi:thioredoxin reductase (NADPH)
MPGFPRLQESYDFAIVGGGHAGLQAGLKAALLGHTAALIDRGPKFSRSYYAPRMDNIPGFPAGISGHKLLDAQIAAVRQVDASVGYFTPAEVTSVERSEEGRFAVTFEWLKQRQVARARAVILAMGVVDRMPVIGGKIDPIFPWANQAIVEFCVLCDGHTLPGKSVAVLGHDAFAARTAIDLLHFHPASVEILTHGRPLLEGSTEAERVDLERRLAEHQIPHHEPEMVGFDGIREGRFHVRFADGSVRQYDKGFSALGWYQMNERIPRSMGARFDADGFVVTDEDCRVLSAATGEPIPGLYCVGDLRNGWNQIPEAWATAERAVIHAYSWYL